jgi:hypothetical protein
LIPADKFLDQLFVGIYAFCGVAVIAAMVSDLALASMAAVTKMLADAKKASLEKSNQLIAAAKKHNVSLHHPEGSKDKKKISKIKKLKSMLHAAMKKYGKLPVTLALMAFQLVMTWEAGAFILGFTEQIEHTKAYYCAVITSISVGMYVAIAGTPSPLPFLLH